MMRGTKRTGISSEVRHSVTVIAVLLAIPVVIGLVIMISYSSRYQAMIQRMDTAAELKPALETTIAEDLFSVAAGRTTFEKSQVTVSVSRIRETLDELSSETEGSGHLQLTIARRTIDTMEQYILQSSGSRRASPRGRAHSGCPHRCTSGAPVRTSRRWTSTPSCRRRRGR